MLTSAVIAPWSIAASAGVTFVLGALHLWLTFNGTRFHPRDADLTQRLMQAHPHITRQTTLWRAGLGFNASHALGLMLFGLVYADLAIAHPDVLFGSGVLAAAGLCFLLALCWLAQRHWFRTPFFVLVLSTGLYITGLACSGSIA